MFNDWGLWGEFWNAVADQILCYQHQVTLPWYKDPSVECTPEAMKPCLHINTRLHVSQLHVARCARAENSNPRTNLQLEIDHDPRTHISRVTPSHVILLRVSSSFIKINAKQYGIWYILTLTIHNGLMLINNKTEKQWFSLKQLQNEIMYEI